MLIGVIDIGSNTARLLIAAPDDGTVRAVCEERAVLALGDEIERSGRISESKLAETADRARSYACIARRHGCAAIEVIVTAPGRQSMNAVELVGRLESATGAPVRVLTAEEEGRLAYAGAVAQATGALRGRVAVCDVGGGSTEVVVGGRGGVEFCESVEVGSLRLTRRLLAGDPPGKKAIAAARREVELRLDGVDVPPARVALATGGSARSLRRLTGGRRLTEKVLANAVRTASKTGSPRLARELDLDPIRARTLLAGALILSEVQQRVCLPLEVARGGLREGAVVALLAERVAA